MSQARAVRDRQQAEALAQMTEDRLSDREKERATMASQRKLEQMTIKAAVKAREEAVTAVLDPPRVALVADELRKASEAIDSCSSPGALQAELCALAELGRQLPHSPQSLAPQVIQQLVPWIQPAADPMLVIAPCLLIWLRAL